MKNLRVFVAQVFCGFWVLVIGWLGCCVHPLLATITLRAFVVANS
ncbi:MAG: hypothetical protein ACOYU6_09105 [Bacteroidota bacterium]